MKFLKRQLPALVLSLLLLLSACAVDTPTTSGTQGSQPTQSTQSTAGTQGTEPTQPTQGSEPTEPVTHPTQGSEPTRPATQPTQGTEPAAPTTQPTQGTEPTQPPTEPDAEHRHTDNNKDELCDECGISVIVRLDFYAINDLHGVFMDTSDNPGVDEMTTFFKNAYADDTAYEILLSSGDMWQGSVESSTNKGELMTKWMNEVGFVSMTLGNHEYDWGSAYIEKNAALAEFPFLGINVTDNNVTSSYCQPSVVVERGGVRIGIIGAVDNFLSSISGEFSDGLNFSTSRLTTLVKAESQRLREQEDCDLIVYSIHGGYDQNTNGVKDYTGTLDYYDISLSDGYVDLVFEGHSHHDYILRDSYGVYHLQAGGYNSAISYAGVTYNLVTDTFEVYTVDTLDQWTYSKPTLADDPIVEELFNQYFPDGNPYTTVLGKNASTRNSGTIAQTVAQLYLEKGRELWGDEYEIVLGGGFIKTRTPYNLAKGNVTYSQLYSLLPFDNDLVLCRVTGRELKDKFINSKNYYCAYDASLTASIVDSQYYYVVTDTYTSFYKYNMLTEVARLEDYYARDLLKDYIAAGNWG